ncbi:FkbM family methyltransferase [Microcystis elabens FACHB-917]|nr:FkbM family methyltransferase [Microcystis elabens FACHB-917]
MAEPIDQIRPLFRRLRDRSQAALPARDTGHGFRFIGSQRRFRHACDELGTIEVLRRLAPGLRGFLNVGANAGFYCLLAEALGLEAVGFEPEPTAFRLLQRNLGLNRSSCLAIPAAVAAGLGRATFYGTGTAGSLLQGLSGTPRWDRRAVTTVPLDGLFAPGGIAPRPTDSLWLLDCEGAEPDALRGARQLLEATHPLLVLELAPSRNHQAWLHCLVDLRLCAYTHLLGCSSLVEGPGRWRPLTADAADDRAFHDNVLVVAEAHHQAFLGDLPLGGPARRSSP